MPFIVCSFYDYDAPIYTMSRFLPPSKVADADISNSILGDGTVIRAGCKIHHSVVGLRSLIQENCTVEDTLLMGSDYYETLEECALIPGCLPMGLGQCQHSLVLPVAFHNLHACFEAGKRLLDGSFVMDPSSSPTSASRYSRVLSLLYHASPLLHTVCLCLQEPTLLYARPLLTRMLGLEVTSALPMRVTSRRLTGRTWDLLSKMVLWLSSRTALSLMAPLFEVSVQGLQQNSSAFVSAQRMSPAISAGHCEMYV